MTVLSRREFLLLAAGSLSASALATETLSSSFPPAGKTPFRLSVFTDEISQDFEVSCRVAREMGVANVELRAQWDKNIVKAEKEELERMRRLLKEYGLGVTAISGPLFKVAWPEAPHPKDGTRLSAAEVREAFAEQEKVLRKEIELADFFGTDRIRCFDFLRLKDQEPYRAAIDATLSEAAEKAGRKGLRLVMENETACNTATAQEAVRTLAAVPNPAFQLIWDPGNSFFAGENPFPDAYKLLPKDRIGHIHCKDARRKLTGGAEWTAMGEGKIDYIGQFRALVEDGFTGPVVLETHWKGGGSKEASTRASMRGMQEQLRRAGALS